MTTLIDLSIAVVLPKIDTVTINKIKYDDQISVPLIKYSLFDTCNKIIFYDDVKNLGDKVVDYRIILNYNFDRTDTDSIKKKGRVIFGPTFDVDSAEFIEIFSLFDLQITSSNIYVNNYYTNYINDLQAMYNITITNVSDNNIKKINVGTIFFKLSNIDLQTDAYLKILYTFLSNLPTIAIGSNLVLQIFNLNVSTIIEFIYYLTSYFSEAYIYKPTVTDIVSESKYVILKKLKTKILFPPVEKKYAAPTIFIKSFDLNVNPNEVFSKVIQCYISHNTTKKYLSYNMFKKFIKNVYNSDAYDNFLSVQNKNSDNWLEIFNAAVTTKKLPESLFNDLYKYSESICQTSYYDLSN
jgi:hypothetical protein